MHNSLKIDKDELQRPLAHFKEILLRSIADSRRTSFCNVILTIQANTKQCLLGG